MIVPAEGVKVDVPVRASDEEEFVAMFEMAQQLDATLGAPSAEFSAQRWPSMADVAVNAMRKAREGSAARVHGTRCWASYDPSRTPQA